jgi:hypothetical protein
VFCRIVPANPAGVTEFCHWLAAELRHFIHAVP